MGIEIDREREVLEYENNYQLHGYSPASLGWTKGKQDIRFSVLLSRFTSLSNPKILDVGCGFGDINKTLNTLYPKGYSYVGIDLVPSFINEAKNKYASNSIEFIQGDFLEQDFLTKFDVVLGSGIFNRKIPKKIHEQLISDTVSKAWALCEEGISFDFLSSKVDFELPHTSHTEPAFALELIYGLTRNLILRNDYFPFEFAVSAFRNQSFETEDTIFSSFKRL